MSEKDSLKEFLKTSPFLKWLPVAFPFVLLGGGFYFLNGNFHKKTISPDKFVEVLEKGDSHDTGFRRAHAKGVCLKGNWQGSAEMSPYSKAEILNIQTPVLGRFSIGPGNPFIADKPALTRSMALKMNTPGGVWETAMNNTPVIPMSNVQDAYDLFKTDEIDPKTGKPDPKAFPHFVETHPWLSPALKILSATQPTSGLSDTTYYGVSAFIARDKAGKEHAVRWKMVPHQAVKPATGEMNDPNYLFKNLIKQAHAGVQAHQPLAWDMVMVIANSAPEIQAGKAPKDIIKDPSKVWNAQDLEIKAGTVRIEKLYSENAEGLCKPMSFDPTVLPKGIELSEDPIPSLRSQIYMKSFYRRAGETQKASEVTAEMIKKGENS
ncbi:catalase [Acetobacteraceae bacterium]|nr:catalase [Acetobacteraceae bacterium]